MVTFAMAALAAASAAYWGLKVGNFAAPSASTAVLAQNAFALNPQAVARALGGGLVAAPAAASVQSAPVASRYALVGVLAANARRGAALISVDGQDAKPVRVGARVDAGTVLLSVSARRAVLSSGADATTRITLDLPMPVN